MSKTVLVVDDETNIVEIIEHNLIKEGYRVITAFDGEEALKKVEKEHPDLILLDVMMPKLDGFAVCKKIRETKSTPIIMLTARAEEVDTVLGLELGADDYVTKPFGMRALMARVKANLRRNDQATESSSPVIEYGELSIFPDQYVLKKRGKVIDLTPREYRLLNFLASSKQKVFSRETLLEKVWDFEFFGDVRTVDVTIRRLREKIEDDAANPQYVMTKRGVGYYFNS